MTSSYLIAENQVIEEIIVNRSRFICYLFPCTSAEEVKTYLKEVQQLHPQASHHCYAYLSDKADSSQHYGFSDDGEPSGTAGRPMLSALQGNGVGQICAIVVRYFGGTKLGTGGLQRAYGGSVRQALTLLVAKTKIPMVSKSLACQYTQLNDIKHVIEKFGGVITTQNFSDNIELILDIPEVNIEETQQQLQTVTLGRVKLKNMVD